MLRAVWRVLRKIMIVLLPLIVYLLWRRHVWRSRHSKEWLKKRFGDKPRALTIAIWADIKEIWRLLGLRFEPQTTPWMSLKQFQEQVQLETDDSELAISVVDSVNKVLFSTAEPIPRALSDMIEWHRRLEVHAQKALPRRRWLFRRFLWSRRHPL